MIEKQFVAAVFPPFLEMRIEDFGVLRSFVILKEDRPIGQVKIRIYELGSMIKAVQ